MRKGARAPKSYFLRRALFAQSRHFKDMPYLFPAATPKYFLVKSLRFLHLVQAHVLGFILKVSRTFKSKVAS